jgi:hypothetical protein
MKDLIFIILIFKQTCRQLWACRFAGLRKLPDDQLGG